jgi:hypothetical protein
MCTAPVPRANGDGMADETFRPGETVPRSGIYKVTHYQHRRPHEVVITARDRFPQCRVCGARVLYGLLRCAEAIDADRDFDTGEAMGTW